MAWHNDLGKWGEDIAAQYLEKNGLQILDRDWRDGHRDIDIVAFDYEKRLLVFVEVKTRSSDNFGQPEEALTLEKQNNIIQAAKAYVRINKMYNLEYRFDTICIIGTPNKIKSFNHAESSFDAYSSTLYYEQKRKRNYYKRRGW